MKRFLTLTCLFALAASPLLSQTVGVTHLRATASYIRVNDDNLREIDDHGVGYGVGMTYNLLPFLDLIGDLGTSELDGKGADLDVDNVAAGVRLVAARNDRLSIYADLKMLRIRSTAEVSLSEVGLEGSLSSHADDTGFAAAFGAEIMIGQTSLRPAMSYNDLFDDSRVVLSLGVHSWCLEDYGFGLTTGYDPDEDEYTVSFSVTIRAGN